MVKTDLPYAYEAIAEQIGIDIDNYTIYDDFCDYFKEVKRFGVQEMLSLFRGIFFVPYVSDLYHKERENTENRESIVLLGRLLSTFKIDSKCMPLIMKLKNFD